MITIGHEVSARPRKRQITCFHDLVLRSTAFASSRKSASCRNCKKLLFLHYALDTFRRDSQCTDSFTSQSHVRKYYMEDHILPAKNAPVPRVYYISCMLANLHW